MFVYQRFPILAGEITTFPDFPHGFFRGPGAGTGHGATLGSPCIPPRPLVQAPGMNPRKALGLGRWNTCSIYIYIYTVYIYILLYSIYRYIYYM